MDSFVETILHVGAIAPFTIGSTLVTVSILKKMSGNSVSIRNSVRIFLTVSICIEFFVGLYHYLGQG